MPRFFILGALAALAAGALFTAQPPSSELDTSLEVTSPEGPIVVELFTSQGCSSCPPADRLFGRLTGDIVPLAFHVDYWNHLGWRDPFSNAEWSARQRRYGEAFENTSVYTPQLVVNGRAEAIGSDLRSVRALLHRAAATAAEAELELVIDTGTQDLFAVTVTARLASSVPRAADLLVAVTEDDLETAIRSGENAHRKLRHHHVVRRLLTVAAIEPGAGTTRSVELELDAGWRRQHLGVVALVQDPRTLAIYGAARWAG